MLPISNILFCLLFLVVMILHGGPTRTLEPNPDDQVVIKCFVDTKPLIQTHQFASSGYINNFLEMD